MDTVVYQQFFDALGLSNILGDRESYVTGDFNYSLGQNFDQLDLDEQENSLGSLDSCRSLNFDEQELNFESLYSCMNRYGSGNESEEDVDIETVDDCEPVTANRETRCTFEYPRFQNAQQPIPDVDMCQAGDSLDDYLRNFSGIEADDVEGLMQKFDSASNFQAPPLVTSEATPSFSTQPLPELTQLPQSKTSSEKQLVQACVSNMNDGERAVNSSCLAENVISNSLPVTTSEAESVERRYVSGNFFDKIPDHTYCLTSTTNVIPYQETGVHNTTLVFPDSPTAAVNQKCTGELSSVTTRQINYMYSRTSTSELVTGQERCEQSNTRVMPDSSTVPVNQKHVAEPCSASKCPKNGLADTTTAACSPRQVVSRHVKTSHSRSLLRPQVSKSSATKPAIVMHPSVASLARSGTTCPSVPRPSCSASSISRSVQLSSTATTSQSSCSDSGSDSERDKTCRPSSSRPSRCYSRSQNSDTGNCRSRSTSSASSCSTTGTRSRSRSRSRVRRNSSRQGFEKAKQEEKRRAMTERRVVYVGNIPSTFTKSDLRRCFSTFGEIEDTSVHFRRQGDNYGFVTFTCPRNAVIAIEKGSNYQGRQFKLCFGGRRIFCETEYADLDGCAAAKEEWALTKGRRDDFDSLLQQSIRRIKKD